MAYLLRHRKQNIRCIRMVIRRLALRMINFELNKGGSKIRIEKILKKLEKIVFKEFKKSGVISIAVVSSNEIKKLNRRYRRKNRPTDILTFVLDDKEILGEIILSLAEIKKRAKSVRKGTKETAIHLIVHGVCHIFGLTHRGKKDTKKMEAEEKKILSKFLIYPRSNKISNAQCQISNN